MFSHKIKKVCPVVLKSSYMLPVIGVFALMGLGFSTAAFGVDHLATVMTSVKENFGADSTFIKIMYLAEIIVGGYTWHKTKNPAAVIGIVILAIFVNFAITKWVV